jgi:cap1 methyltransferase
VRESVFPQDKKGSSRFWNRAGDKLMQVIDATNLFSGLTHTTFIDICGGPGAFTQVLLENGPKPSHGYGMTLDIPNTPNSDIWYKKLLDCPYFTILKGEDGTGNVYNPANLDYIVKKIEDAGDKGKINFFVGDGGFEIRKTADGTHMENLQELFSGRIILSEFLLMMRTLSEGGRFVCKMFDTSSDISASLLYLLTLVFEKVFIVKPIRSRIVNSERYVVGKGMRRHGRSHALLTSILQQLHQKMWDDKEEDVLKQKSPKSVLPLSQMFNDKEFVHLVK